MNRNNVLKSSSFILGSVGISLLVAACSGPEEPAPFAVAANNGLEQRLEAETGSKWHVARGAAGAPQTLAPIASVHLPGSTTEEAARTFLGRYGADLGSADLRDLGPAEEVSSPDGAKAVHFAHVIPSTRLPVFERGSGLEVDANGDVSFVESGLGLTFSETATSASVSEARAKDVASATLASVCGEAPVVTEAVLGGYPDERGAVRLAYRVQAGAGGTCRAPVVYVDAANEEILRRRDESPAYLDTVRGGSSHYWNDATDAKTIDVSQGQDFRWQLRTQSAQAPVETRDYRDGNVISDSVLGQWDRYDYGIAVDAHFHATRALEYYRDAHGRRGLDGRGGLLRVYVHDNSSGNYNGDNATYHPGDATIHLGDGDPRTKKYLPMALSFDVLVHEIGHGVIAHTSRLVYERESGALNESFADVMAVSAKMWAPEARARATFKLGANSVNEGVYTRPFMRDVLAPDPDIDGGYRSYAQVRPCAKPDLAVNDACWVHSLSGIGNRAFAMMAVGGEELSPRGPRIAIPEALGFARAAYVWYQSITTLANPHATFRDAAIAQLKVAERISPAARTAVGCAWAAVDVLSPSEQLLWSLVCTSTRRVPKQATCAAVGTGVMCNPSTAFGAIECKSGSIAGGQHCNIPKRCVQLSPTDFRAVVDTQGQVVCQ